MSIIKFGIAGYGKNDNGFVPKREFTKFASIINENDIWSNINYQSKNDPPLIEKMYDNIAQDDRVISESELRDYMEKLEKAAKKKGDAEILDAEELYEFYEENKIVKKRSKFRKLLDKLFGSKKRHQEKYAMNMFVGALVKANDYIADKEEKAAIQKLEDEMYISMRTTYDKNGNKVYTSDDGYRTVYDKNEPDKSITYDTKGRIFEKNYKDCDAQITERNYYISDKKNAKSEKYKLIKYDDKNYNETYYNVNGLRKKHYLRSGDFGTQIYYDDKGREDSGYSSERGIITEKFKCEYYKNGELRRRETKHYDYIWGNLTATEVELFDENGNLTDYYTDAPKY